MKKIASTAYDTKKQAEAIYNKIIDPNNIDRIDTSAEIVRAFEAGFGWKAHLFGSEIINIRGFKDIESGNNTFKPSLERIYKGVKLAFEAGVEARNEYNDVPPDELQENSKTTVTKKRKIK